jgi:PAS domain S-box-containing protein
VKDSPVNERYFSRILTSARPGKVSPLTRYTIAVLSIAVAYLIILVVESLFTQYNPRFLFLIGAVVFSAWYGGPRAGLVATLGSTILNYFIVPPVLDPSHAFERWVLIGLFALVGLAICGLEALRQRTEAALKHEQELLETVFDFSPVMLIIYWPETDILRLNSEFERLTGWTTTAANEGEFLEMCYPDPAYRAEVRAYLDSGDEGWRDLRVTTRDGRSLDSSWSNIRLRDNTQVTIGIDIRERKAAEGRIRLLQELTAEFSRAITLAQVANVVIHKAVPALGGQFGAVYLLTEDNTNLDLISDFDMPEVRRKQATRMAVDEDLPLPDAVRIGQPIWLESLEEISAYYPRLIEAVRPAPIYPASASLPLTVNKQVIGAIYITFPQLRKFTAAEKEFFVAITDHCAQAMERAQLYESEYQARQEMEKAATRITRLQIVTAALSEALTADQVGQIIIDQGVLVMGAAAGTFQLLVENGSMFETRYTSGGRLDEQEQGKWKRYMADMALPVVKMLRTKQALWFRSADEVAREYPLLADYAPLYPGAAAIVPVIIDGEVIGSITFAFDEVLSFSEEEKTFVNTLAQQCAQALQRVSLAEQANAAAANEERQRLARDLHDAVSQTLFAATTIAESAPLLWQRDPSRAEEQLQQLVRLNRAAMAEMRNLLLELRPEALLKSSLSLLLKHLTDAAKGRKNIEVELLVEVNDDVIPATIHVALYRIAQESINNILKHSQATQFSVHLARQESLLKMSIADNGRGFDTQQLSAGLGLASMRERADEIGATLDVTSQLGQGTHINVVWNAAISQESSRVG